MEILTKLYLTKQNNLSGIYNLMIKFLRPNLSRCSCLQNIFRILKDSMLEQFANIR